MSLRPAARPSALFVRTLTTWDRRIDDRFPAWSHGVDAVERGAREVASRPGASDFGAGEWAGVWAAGSGLQLGSACRTARERSPSTPIVCAPPPGRTGSRIWTSTPSAKFAIDLKQHCGLATTASARWSFSTSARCTARAPSSSMSCSRASPVSCATPPVCSMFRQAVLRAACRPISVSPASGAQSRFPDRLDRLSGRRLLPVC